MEQVTISKMEEPVLNKETLRAEFHRQVFRKIVFGDYLNNQDRRLFAEWFNNCSPAMHFFEHYKDKRVLFEIVKYLKNNELCLNENIRWLYASKVEYLLKIISFYRVLEHRGINKKGEPTQGLTFYCGLSNFKDRPAPPFSPKEKTEWQEDWTGENRNYLKYINSYNFGLDLDGENFNDSYADALKVFKFFKKFNIRFSIWCSGKKGFHCLPAQEKILVKYNGRIRLADLRWVNKIINEGKQIYVKDDKDFVKVIDSKKRKVKNGERLVKFETKGFLSFRMSEDHKQPILRNNKIILCNAKDVMISDMLPISISNYEGSNEGTYDLGRFIGLYLAEGHSLKRNKTVGFTFDKSEMDYCNFIKDFCSKLGAIVTIRDCGNCYRVRTHSHTIFSLLEDYVNGTNSRNKGLNCKIFGMAKSFREGIIDGWLEGDGLHRQYQKGTTASKGLARCIQMLGLTVNRIFTINLHKIKGYKDYYNLWWIKNPSDSDAVKFDSEKDIYFVKIRRKTYYKKEIDLVDINVDSNSHLFCVARGLLTHNCIIPYEEFKQLVEPFEIDFTVSFCKGLMIDLVKHLKLKKVDTVIYSTARYLKCPYSLDMRNGRVILPLNDSEFLDFNKNFDKYMSIDYCHSLPNLGHLGAYRGRETNPEGFNSMIDFLGGKIK